MVSSAAGRVDGAPPGSAEATTESIEFPDEARAAFREDRAMRLLAYWFVALSIGLWTVFPARQGLADPLNLFGVGFGLVSTVAFGFVAFYSFGPRYSRVEVGPTGIRFASRGWFVPDLRIAWASPRRVLEIHDAVGPTSMGRRPPEAAIRAFVPGLLRPQFFLSGAAWDAVSRGLERHGVHASVRRMEFGPNDRIVIYSIPAA